MFLKHKKLRDYNHLTLLQAFVAMGLYLEEYFGTTNLAKDIEFFVYNTQLARDEKRVDPILWQNWLKCVDEVLAVKDSRMYFHLLPKGE